VPTYQYACTACAERLEVVQRFTDDALTVCPECGGALRKVYSAVGVVFKGSGFYKTDSRGSRSSSGSSSTSSTSGSSSSDAASSGGSSGGSSEGAAPAAAPTKSADSSSTGSKPGTAAAS
jgi:putative FmdB family regulatory protein